MMDRETWLGRILEAIRDLADERHQERVWVRGEGPEVDSSTGAICRAPSGQLSGPGAGFLMNEA